jgi:hypothetical protein
MSAAEKELRSKVGDWEKFVQAVLSLFKLVK